MAVFISLDELVAATGIAKDRLCRACFDGVYPVELPPESVLGKHALESLEIVDSQMTAIDEAIRRP